jgi:hypothetical protein
MELLAAGRRESCSLKGKKCRKDIQGINNDALSALFYD